MYKTGNRHQIAMLPTTIEEYIQEDDPARVYDSFVESLNFEELSINIDHTKVGSPEYDPKSMLKILLYGYSYGIRSSRKIERATHHNLSFIWLGGGLKPDHKTIANFRRNNAIALKKVLKQCVKLCIRLNLIEGNTLFVDGTKIKANASIENGWDDKKCNKHINEIEKHIDEILKECEKVDQTEDGQKSLVKLQNDLKDKKTRKTKIQKILQEIKEGEKNSKNTTDQDCVRVKIKNKVAEGYNAQVVTDEKYGLIINTEVVTESGDNNQFSRQIDQANEILGKNCSAACADAGYTNTDNLKNIVDQNIDVIVPSQKQALKNPKENEFSKDKFIYNKKNDFYVCPKGNTLYFSFIQSRNNIQIGRVYQIEKHKICLNCNHFGKCTTNKKGRRISRLLNEETKELLEKLYKSEKGQKIYKKRKQKCELQFGHIKHNLGYHQFLLRKKRGVDAEMSIMASCFNISRTMSIIGDIKVLKQLTA